MSHRTRIMNSVNYYPALKIIDAQKVYNEKFSDIPEPTFFKVVSRMTQEGSLKRISKGIYCKPKLGKYGVIMPSEKNILEYYLGEKGNKGVVIGYQLFNKYGLTTQISKVVTAYSSEITQQNKTVKNIKIQKANLNFDNRTIKMVELLEVLQEYMNIEDLNKKSLLSYLEKSISHYDEKILDKIMKSMNYKKHTIASLKTILDYYNVENSLSKYLNGTSRYNTINMEELHAITPKQ